MDPSMSPCNKPFNALIVGPTNSGKSAKFVVNQLSGPLCGKFDYIVLICPTFVQNKTTFRFAERDPRFFVIPCEQHMLEYWLKIVRLFLEGTNTIIILDCPASKDVKGRMGQLVDLSFSARHIGISVWVFTQQITSITKPFHENVAKSFSFTPSAKTTKAIFEDYAGGLTQDKYKELIFRVKHKFSHLVVSLTG